MTAVEIVHPSEPVCGLVEGSCICVEPPEHGGPHVCACGGSWTLIDGKFSALTPPGSNPEFWS